jgi:hypothetical protein
MYMENRYKSAIICLVQKQEHTNILRFNYDIFSLIQFTLSYFHDFFGYVILMYEYFIRPKRLWIDMGAGNLPTSYHYTIWPANIFHPKKKEKEKGCASNLFFRWGSPICFQLNPRNASFLTTLERDQPAFPSFSLPAIPPLPFSSYRRSCVMMGRRGEFSSSLQDRNNKNVTGLKKTRISPAMPTVFRLLIVGSNID